jgi:hypothetical protein
MDVVGYELNTAETTAGYVRRTMVGSPRSE